MAHLYVAQVDIENATETARFYESQAGELEEKLLQKEKTIKDLEHSLQVILCGKSQLSLLLYVL